MVSTNISGGMELSEEELRHLKVEMYDVAMGMPPEDGPAPSAPLHFIFLSADHGCGTWVRSCLT